MGADGLQFILHLPETFELHFALENYCVTIPYSMMLADIGIGTSKQRRRHVIAHSVTLIPPDTPIRLRTIEPVECLIVSIPSAFAEAIFDDTIGDNPWLPEVVLEMADAGTQSVAREIRRCLIGDPIASPTYLSALTRALLARLACKLANLDVGTLPPEALSPVMLKTITQTIESRLADGLLVSDLADLAGLSRSHFTRAFRAATGQSPQDFIISRKLSRARAMLSESTRPLADIAADSGFSSQPHLTRMFRSRLGLTPMQYRAAFSRW